jgi:hypothetical protein
VATCRRAASHAPSSGSTTCTWPTPSSGPWSPARPSTRRPAGAWRRTAKSSSRSTTSPPSTGGTSAPPTPSSPPSAPCGIEHAAPRAAEPEPPRSRWSTAGQGGREALAQDQRPQAHRQDLPEHQVQGRDRAARESGIVTQQQAGKRRNAQDSRPRDLTIPSGYSRGRVLDWPLLLVG